MSRNRICASSSGFSPKTRALPRRLISAAGLYLVLARRMTRKPAAAQIKCKLGMIYGNYIIYPIVFCLLSVMSLAKYTVFVVQG